MSDLTQSIGLIGAPSVISASLPPAFRRAIVNALTPSPSSSPSTTVATETNQEDTRDGVNALFLLTDLLPQTTRLSLLRRLPAPLRRNPFLGATIVASITPTTDGGQETEAITWRDNVLARVFVEDVVENLTDNGHVMLARAFVNFFLRQEDRIGVTSSSSSPLVQLANDDEHADNEEEEREEEEEEEEEEEKSDESTSEPDKNKNKSKNEKTRKVPYRSTLPPTGTKQYAGEHKHFYCHICGRRFQFRRDMKFVCWKNRHGLDDVERQDLIRRWDEDYTTWGPWTREEAERLGRSRERFRVILEGEEDDDDEQRSDVACEVEDEVEDVLDGDALADINGGIHLD